MEKELNFSLGKTIASLLDGKKYAALKDVLKTMNAADIAAIFDELPEGTLAVLFRLLGKETAAETFAYMEPDRQQMLVERLSDAELRSVMEELYVDDAADLIEEMPANVVSRILRHTPPEKRKIINELLKYPEDSAGSIMTTEYVALRLGMTVQDAMERIRRVGVDKETINTLFVVDKTRHLVGTIPIRSLILAEETAPVEDLVKPGVIWASTAEDQESVASKLAKYDLISIPIVDGEERLVGIVTIDDAVDVLVEEATEDMEKMAAMTPSDKPYLKTGVGELWMRRIPWLLLLMISATFTGLIITGFESALSSVVVLTAYIPMLMDTGGNSGSQASVSVIRSLSLGEVEFRDVLRIVWKEFRVSLLCGLTLAVVGFGKMLLLDGVGISVAMVVSLTLLLTVTVAKLAGCTLPILAKRIGLDPAVCASPFITTIVDAISLLIYFTIATCLLGLG